MMFFIFLLRLYSYRLLKPKILENKNLYLTDINSKLSLAPFGDKENQRISIHKRKIIFADSKQLALDVDSLEIKLKKEKIVTYLKRPKNLRKKADPFGFKNKKRPPETTKETSKQNRTVKISERPEIRKRSQYKEDLKILPKKVEIDDDTLEETTKIESSKQDSLKNDQTIDMDSILSKVKHLLNEKKNYLVESDSKIEEDIVKYSNLEVYIHPLSDKYIKLKTEEKDCVTFFKNSFIFSPCLNVDSQIFKLENEEDVLKNNKTFSNDNFGELEINLPKKQEKSFSFIKKDKNWNKSNEKTRNKWSEEYSDDSSYKDNYSEPSYKIESKSEKKMNFSPDFNRKKVKSETTQKSNSFSINDDKIFDNLKNNYGKIDNTSRKLKSNISSPITELFNKKNVSLDFKSSREYVPPSIKEKSLTKNLPNKSPGLSTDQNIPGANLGTTDDFLQKIKNSVSMPELDDLL